MSETLTAARTPIVYFIDDSATMREVIKIAFRKENIHVITCPDAGSALEQFGETAPDAVITDVIMPDKDGYQVCQFIKEHEQLGRTPVILMSGVVNRTVAEKAMAVKADELIRKPFQPNDLVARVKNLLHPKPDSAVANDATARDSAQPAARSSSEVLTSLFSAGPVPAHATSSMPARSGASTVTPASARPGVSLSTHTAAPPPAAEIQKLRNEIRRLELLVKKLQAELEAEHQYCTALEAHFKTSQELP